MLVALERVDAFVIRNVAALNICLYFIEQSSTILPLFYSPCIIYLLCFLRET